MEHNWPRAAWTTQFKIWNVNTGEVLRTLTGHAASVESVAWSPDGTQLASGSYDNTVIIWNVDTGNVLQTLTVDTDSWVNSVGVESRWITISIG